MKNLLTLCACILFLTCCNPKQEKQSEKVNEDELVKDITAELESASQQVKSVTEEKLIEIDTLLENL